MITYLIIAAVTEFPTWTLVQRLKGVDFVICISCNYNALMKCVYCAMR